MHTMFYQVMCQTQQFNDFLESLSLHLSGIEHDDSLEYLISSWNHLN